jgi:hypothetical protein
VKITKEEDKAIPAINLKVDFGKRFAFMMFIYLLLEVVFQKDLIYKSTIKYIQILVVNKNT